MKLSRCLLFTLLCLVAASPAYAAGAMPSFMTEMVCLIVVSAAMGYLCFRLGLVPILGFLLTGVVLNAAGLVQNERLVESLAEIGVILLLFTIGIEFSLESLMRIRRLIFVGGGLQVGVTTGLVTGALHLLGVDWRSGLFTGLLVSLSSTAIVLKLLESRGETRSDRGRLAVGMLIFQDLAVVAMVIGVPLLGARQDGGAQDLLLSLGMAVAIIAGVLILARRLVPKLLEALARTCSQEIFLLGVIAICLGTAFITGFAGVSLSLGAFLAGLLVSESRFGSQALGEILPLQILFSATFFVSVGLLLDLGFLVSHLSLILVVVAAVLALKAMVTSAAAKVLGYSLGSSLAAGLLLAQVGEFSFVLEQAGREVGLSPAGVAGAGGQTFIAATVVLMALTPFLAQAGSAVQRVLERRRESSMVKAHAKDSARVGAGTGSFPGSPGSAGLDRSSLRDHVLILGYGRSGRWLAHRLLDLQVPHLVLTLSPTGAAQAESAGIPVLRGDYSKLSLLVEAQLRHARLVVIADDTLEMAKRTLALVRANVPEMPILVKIGLEEDAQALSDAGAAFAVSEEGPSHRALLEQVLTRLGVSAPKQTSPRVPKDKAVEQELPAMTFELSQDQRQSKACSHIDQTRAVAPEAQDICPQCVALGDRWLHLRLCMTCGQVGCCDSSKNRHARAHAAAAGHPVIRSLEPGEEWAWCFVDEAVL